MKSLTTEGVRGVSRLTALTNLVIDVGRDVSLEEQQLASGLTDSDFPTSAGMSV